MPVKQTIPYSFGTFFITFTCFKWLSLIEISAGYDIIYKWFDYLKNQHHYINAYVTMPNHVHAIISFTEKTQTINTIIGNGKRFMAYEIIKRLKDKGHDSLLQELTQAVEPHRKLNKKIHNVWELSFDWKECVSEKFTDQKMDYIHNNPCKGKWNLCTEPGEYLHSSAKFHYTGVQGIYSVDHIGKMQDVVFTKNG